MHIRTVRFRQIFNRFSYIYLAAQLLENRTAEDVTETRCSITSSRLSQHYR